MKPLLSLIFLIGFSNQIVSQTYYEGDYKKMDPSKIEKWNVKDKSEYQGIFHFGFSEGESTFLLIISEDSCYAQLKRGNFIENGRDFIWNYLPFKKVRIEGNMFYSDKTNGEFVSYDKTFGLIVNKSWTWNESRSEFGFKLKNVSVENYFGGKFPQASYLFLTKSELEKMSPSELKIMRNEVYARYGFIFSFNGEMDKYFKGQKWYSPKNTNVDKCMTDLEKQNIKLIQSIEKQYGL
jgi:hypothetical protein